MGSTPKTPSSPPPPAAPVSFDGVTVGDSYRARAAAAARRRGLSKTVLASPADTLPALTALPVAAPAPKTLLGGEV